MARDKLTHTNTPTTPYSTPNEGWRLEQGQTRWNLCQPQSEVVPLAAGYAGTAPKHFKKADMRRSCFKHCLSQNFGCEKSCISKLRKKVLKLLKMINTSGVANQERKKHTGKKLFKMAKTKWNSLFVVLQHALLLKSAIISVYQERALGIDLFPF